MTETTGPTILDVTREWLYTRRYASNLLAEGYDRSARLMHDYAETAKAEILRRLAALPNAPGHQFLKDLELDVLRHGGQLLDPMTDAYDDEHADDTAHLERLEAHAEARRDGDHDWTVER